MARHAAHAAEAAHTRTAAPPLRLLRAPSSGLVNGRAPSTMPSTGGVVVMWDSSTSLESRLGLHIPMPCLCDCNTVSGASLVTDGMLGSDGMYDVACVPIPYPIDCHGK